MKKQTNIPSLRFPEFKGEWEKKKLGEVGFSKGRIIKKNSILYVCIGSTIGKLVQNQEDCITNQQINSIVPFSNFSEDFVYSLLEYHSPKIRLMAATQAVPIINKTTFSNIILSVPCQTNKNSKFFVCS